MSNNGSVKQTLFKSYVVFTVITVILFVVCLTGGAVRYRDTVETGLKSFSTDYDKFIDMSIVKSMNNDFEDLDVSFLENINGWVEIVDESCKVIYSSIGYDYEDKQYSWEELYKEEYLENRGYLLNATKIKNNKDERYVVILRANEELYYNSFADNIFIEFIKSLGMSVALFVLLFFINIFIFSRLVGARITNPLHVLTDKLRDVPNSTGQDKIHYTNNVETEFVEIADSFNYMIDEIIRTEEQKRQAEDDKKKMIVDISHDIKTPITAIQGYARAMTDGIVKDEKEREKYLNTICMKAQSVTELINLLFEYVKLDHRSYELNVENKDVTEIARQIIAEYYDEIVDNKFDVDLKIPENKIMVDIDGMQIKRVISNIITNSLKYNGEGTKIVMNLYEDGENAVIEVGDDGVGIPDEIRKTVFEPFVRADQHKSSKISGSGIGLSIVKKIVELHNGEIKLVEGKNHNSSMFKIVLPKKRN